MFGQGTTYGFALSVLLHIALCICVIGCLTWLGTILQVGSEIRLHTWFGLAIHLVRHALLLWQHCSDCFCLLCYVISCFGGIKPPRGGGGFIPQKGWLYPPTGLVLSPPPPQRGGFIPVKSGHNTTRGGFKGGFIPHVGWFYARDRPSTTPVCLVHGPAPRKHSLADTVYTCVYPTSYLASRIPGS